MDYCDIECCALSAGGCDRRTKRGREELPHIRGEGQKPGGPHARRAAAKRSYPISEVRGSSREHKTATVQERPRGTTPRPRSGRAAERRYPESEVRGGDERSYPVSKVRGHGREEIPHASSPRPGATGRRSYHTPLSPRPRAVAGRSNRSTEARGGGREDQPHVQGAVAAWAQKGLEELSHIEGQEGQQ